MLSAKGARPPYWLGLVLWGLLLLLPGLSSLPPLDRDEPRYAQASKQMLASGIFHDISFQQETRYKKPIGIYWLQSLSNAAFGAPPYDTIWPYRLPSLLGGILALILTAWGFGRITDSRTGALAALILGCNLLLVFEGHIAKTDAALLACITGAQLILFQVYRGVVSSRAAYGFWLLQAAAILIKGPIAPLFSLLTIAALGIADRKLTWLKALRPKRGLLLCILLVLPWLVAIGFASQGRFYQEAVGHDFLGKLFSGQERRALPPGYHSLLFFALFLPHITLVLMGLAQLWQRRHEPIARFLLAWIVPGWLLYELVATKLPHYVLPCYPALACAAAMVLTMGALPQSSFWRIALRLQAIALTAIALAFIAAAWWLEASPVLLSLAALGALMLFWQQARLFWLKPILSCLLGTAAATLLFIGSYSSLLPAISAYWLSPQIRAAYFAAHPCPLLSRLVTEGYNEPSIVFLAGTNTVFANGGGFAARLLTHDRCSVVVVRDDLAAGFLADIASLDDGVEPIGQLRGYNYNGGGWQTYHLYRAARQDPLWSAVTQWLTSPVRPMYPYHFRSPDER